MARTADVSPAPVRDALQLNAQGIITSPGWLAWLLRTVTPTLRLTLDVRNEGVFHPAPDRESEPEIRHIAELAAGAERDRRGAAVDELRRLTAASAESGRQDVDPLERYLASVEVRRPGTDLQWFADTHANRLALYPAAAFPTGSRFFETDRKVTYIDVAGHWVYVSGSLQGTLSPDQKPADLGADDAGFRFEATDYKHVHRWTGSAWEFALGDEGSGFFRDFAIAPGAGAWQICDGSATTYAKSDGTTAAFTTPDLTTGAYRKGGAYTGTVNNAGTWALSGNTGDTSAGTPAGTVSQPTLSMNSYTPAGIVSQPTFAGNALGSHQHELPFAHDSGTLYTIDRSTAGFGTSGAVYATQGKLALAAPTGNVTPDLSKVETAGTPTGTVSQPTFAGFAATPTGTVSQPTFAGTALAAHHHALSSGTVTLTGDAVKNIAVPVYFRR